VDGLADVLKRLHQFKRENTQPDVDKVKENIGKKNDPGDHTGADTPIAFPKGR
jgi:hypothetical protein